MYEYMSRNTCHCYFNPYGIRKDNRCKSPYPGIESLFFTWPRVVVLLMMLLLLLFGDVASGLVLAHLGLHAGHGEGQGQDEDDEDEDDAAERAGHDVNLVLQIDVVARLQY